MFSHKLLHDTLEKYLPLTDFFTITLLSDASVFQIIKQIFINIKNGLNNKENVFKLHLITGKYYSNQLVPFVKIDCLITDFNWF